MAENDHWCQLCEDKPKQTTVKYYGKTIEVCKHCASMYIEEENVISYKTKKSNKQMVF